MEAPRIHYSVQETAKCRGTFELLHWLWGDISPLHFLPFCLQPFMSAAPPCVHLHRQTGTTQRRRDCITAVVLPDSQWWVYGVAADRVTDDLNSLVSPWCLTADSQACWRGAFPMLWLTWGLLREECSRRECCSAEGLADLQITQVRKRIGLICEHAHTCA